MYIRSSYTNDISYQRTVNTCSSKWYTITLSV